MAFSKPKKTQNYEVTIHDNLEGISEIKTDKGILKVQHCTNKEGHEIFIPKTEFKKSHLPEVYQSDDFMEFINVLCDLTVRITVNFISPGRPQSDPFYKSKNKKVTMYGTGTVTDVKNLSEEANSFDCVCSTCINETKANNWTVTILTACHVVFDCLEVKNTTVDFFYDDERNVKQIKTLTGFCVRERNIDQDTCFFQCLSEDIDLFSTLRTRLNQFKKADKTFNVKPAIEQNVVVASHPHGLCKHITVGQWSAFTEDYTVIGDYSFYSLSAMANSNSQPNQSDTSIFHPPPRPTIINKDRGNHQSELVGIECEVHFPDFTTAKCQITIHDIRVRDIKLQLIQVGGIHIPAEELYLEIALPNGDLQKMNDDEEMIYYMNDILDCTHINMSRINS